MTDQSHDKDFEAFLAGESDLTERYAELGREAPPPEVDARILAEAHAAAKIHQAEFGPRGGWLKPVALAATVLLSFSLVMNVVIESPTRFEQVAAESAKTSVGLEADIPAKKWRALATPSAGLSQPSTMAAVQKDRVLEEQSSADGDSSARIEIKADHGASAEIGPEIDAMANAVAQAEMGRSVETITVTARRISRDTELMIVTEYVEALDTNMASGLVAGLAAAPELKSMVVRKAERSGPATADSVAAATDKVSADELRPDDGAGKSADQNPEALLRTIERLRANGESDAALIRLDEFLQRYPEHPVSIKIRQREN